MLIRLNQPKVLMPVPARQWREPSQAQPKDQFGNQNRTFFTIELWTRDGGCEGVFRFEDRDEFDRALYRVLIEDPHPHLVPLWFATSFVTTTDNASNQTYITPVDWNNGANTIEVVAGGGAGGVEHLTSTNHGTGGGGGGYSAAVNVSLGATASFFLGTAVSNSRSTSGTSPGVDGRNVWFNGATLGASSVGAEGGKAGAVGSGSRSGGLGGAAANGTGSTKRSGGRGGNLTGGSGYGSSGGGGAAGISADGNAGGDSTSTGTNIVTSGGSGDGGAGGAGSAGSTTAQTTGGNGTEWDATHGSGGGSGGSIVTSTAASSTGGAYGAGGGAARQVISTGSSTSTGGMGLIVITYTPAPPSSGKFLAFM